MQQYESKFMSGKTYIYYISFSRLLLACPSQLSVDVRKKKSNTFIHHESFVFYTDNGLNFSLVTLLVMYKEMFKTNIIQE